jgi:hypothetical protein
MQTTIAIAILCGVPWIGIAMYKKGFAAIFRPKSRVVSAVLGSIMIAQIVVAMGVLAFGGWWYELSPWCALLVFAYFWIRGAYLLLQRSDRPNQGIEG